MQVLKRALKVLILIACFELSAGQSAADELKDRLLKAGIPETSRFFAYHAGHVQAHGSLLLEQTQSVPQAIIQHVRSNKGKPFSADLSSKVEAIGPVIRPAPERASYAEELIKRNTEQPKLRDCKEDKTIIKGPPMDMGNVRPEPASVDTLYIRRSQLPQDPEIVFGNAEVKVFDDSKFSYENVAIAGSLVPCLPFRVRAYGSNVLLDYGKNALMNYEKSAVKGELHEVVKNTLIRR